MRRKLKGFLSSFVALLIALGSMAQTKNVSGTITDAKNEPVANATVTVRGTNRATQTNANGFYTIAAQKGETLLITAIGQKDFYNFCWRRLRAECKDGCSRWTLAGSGKL
jgi:hypothetical protein